MYTYLLFWLTGHQIAWTKPHGYLSENTIRSWDARAPPAPPRTPPMSQWQLSPGTLAAIGFKRHILDCGQAWDLMKDPAYKVELKALEQEVKQKVYGDLQIFYDQLRVSLLDQPQIHAPCPGTIWVEEGQEANQLPALASFAQGWWNPCLQLHWATNDMDEAIQCHWSWHSIALARPPKIGSPRAWPISGPLCTQLCALTTKAVAHCKEPFGLEGRPSGACIQGQTWCHRPPWVPVASLSVTLLPSFTICQYGSTWCAFGRMASHPCIGTSSAAGAWSLGHQPADALHSPLLWHQFSVLQRLAAITVSRGRSTVLLDCCPAPFPGHGHRHWLHAQRCVFRWRHCRHWWALQTFVEGWFGQHSVLCQRTGCTMQNQPRDEAWWSLGWSTLQHGHELGDARRSFTSARHHWGCLDRNAWSACSFCCCWCSTSWSLLWFGLCWQLCSRHPCGQHLPCPAGRASCCACDGRCCKRTRVASQLRCLQDWNRAAFGWSWFYRCQAQAPWEWQQAAVERRWRLLRAEGRSLLLPLRNLAPTRGEDSKGGDATRGSGQAGLGCAASLLLWQKVCLAQEQDDGVYFAVYVKTALQLPYLVSSLCSCCWGLAKHDPEAAGHFGAGSHTGGFSALVGRARVVWAVACSTSCWSAPHGTFAISAPASSHLPCSSLAAVDGNQRCGWIVDTGLRRRLWLVSQVLFRSFWNAPLRWDCGLAAYHQSRLHLEGSHQSRGTSLQTLSAIHGGSVYLAETLQPFFPCWWWSSSGWTSTMPRTLDMWAVWEEFLFQEGVGITFCALAWLSTCGAAVRRGRRVSRMLSQLPQ